MFKQNSNLLPIGLESTLYFDNNDLSNELITNVVLKLFI